MPDAGTGDRRHVVADAHNDLLMLVARRPVPLWGSYFRTQILPQLHAGGVDVQILPVFVDDEFRPELALRQMLRMIEAAHRIAEENADAVEICTTYVEVEHCLAGGRIALVLAIESCAAIGESLEFFDILFRLGVRIASFTHMGRTSFADGSAENDAHSRLTGLGVEALREMERLGIVLDVSHLGAAGLDHVLEIAVRPIMATHSSAAAVHPHHRNLTDEHLHGIAELGGIACANFYPSFLASSEATMAHAIEHIEHMVDIMGPTHVGLGPDFIHEYYGELSEAERVLMLGRSDNIDVIPGMEGPTGFPLVAEALGTSSLPSSVVEGVLGANLVSFLDTVLT